ncbi:G-protein-coupled receptor family protein [Balamuthia mandrillaris]
MERPRLCVWLLGILVVLGLVSNAVGQDIAILTWDESNEVLFGNETDPDTTPGACADDFGDIFFCFTVPVGTKVRWRVTEGYHGVQATDETWVFAMDKWEGNNLPRYLTTQVLPEVTSRTLAIEHTFRTNGTFYFRDTQQLYRMRGRITIEGSPEVDGDDDDEDEHLENYYEFLSWLTLVLLLLSVAGALCTIITFAVFKDIRTYPIKLIMYLCVCIVISNLFFVFAFEEPFLADDALCFVTGLVVHTFFLASFCWTFCIAFNFYQMIFKRNRESESLERWYHMFSWGFPIFCSIFVTCFQKYGDSTGACYISETLFVFLFFFLPGLIIVAANSILFFFVAREIHETLASAPNTEKRERKKEFRVYISIFISIGLSWIFGFIMVLFTQLVIRTIFLTLFSIFTPLQGFLIFILYCLNKKVLGKWAGLFGKCMPFCRRWENLDSRGTTSTGRTASSTGSRYSRSTRSTSSMSSRTTHSATETASMDTTDMSTDTSFNNSSDEDDFRPSKRGGGAGRSRRNRRGSSSDDDDYLDIANDSTPSVATAENEDTDIGSTAELIHD